MTMVLALKRYLNVNSRRRVGRGRGCSAPRGTLALVAVFILSGCASVTTLDDAARVGTPKIYSGTRLDVHAAAGNRVALRRFPVPAPCYPLLDLPFSFVVDTLVLPLTVSAACYEAVFY